MYKKEYKKETFEKEKFFEMGLNCLIYVHDWKYHAIYAYSV